MWVPDCWETILLISFHDGAALSGKTALLQAVIPMPLKG